MRFVDAHLHTDMIEDVQLQKLVMMGMEAAVIPSPHMFIGTHDADTVLLLWERFLTMEATTAKTPRMRTARTAMVRTRVWSFIACKGVGGFV